MKVSGIKETCIYIKDIERTRDFYYGKLRLPLIAVAEGRHIFFRAGASVLLCFIASATLNEKELPPHGATGKIHFAFEVEKPDYQGSLNEMRAAGITILHEHTWPNGLRSFYFEDPDGNLIEVIEQGLWES